MRHKHRGAVSDETKPASRAPLDVLALINAGRVSARLGARVYFTGPRTFDVKTISGFTLAEGALVGRPVEIRLVTYAGSPCVGLDFTVPTGRSYRAGEIFDVEPAGHRYELRAVKAA